MFRILAGLLFFTLTASAAEEAPVNPHVEVANRTLAQAGLPTLPTAVKELHCYAWSGLSAGIYASLLFEEEKDFAAFQAVVSRGLNAASPIPRNLLAPPNSATPWFTPEALANGTVFYRGRITRAAPEILRWYGDAAERRVFLYYSWNNKRTYP